MAGFLKVALETTNSIYRGLRKLECKLFPTVIVVGQQFEELVRMKVPF